jgi:hypothetical protein
MPTKVVILTVTAGLPDVRIGSPGAQRPECR